MSGTVIVRGNWAESDGWHALVTDGLDFIHNAAGLYVMRPSHDGRQWEAMDPITGYTRVSDEREGAGGVGSAPPIRLPLHALPAVRDAIANFLGKPRDDYRARYEEARDALAVERARVDNLLTRALQP